MGTTTRKSPTELKVGDAVVILGAVEVVRRVQCIDGRLWDVETPSASFQVWGDDLIEVEERAPGPYDGYVSETEDGWQVASEGQIIGTYADESVAATVAARGKMPCWKVTLDGRTTRLG